MPVHFEFSVRYINVYTLLLTCKEGAKEDSLPFVNNVYYMFLLKVGRPIVHKNIVCMIN